MAGRPRRRRAESLAGDMLRDLHERGPSTISDLLNRRLCGPTDWEQMERWEQAASRMAIGILIGDYKVRLDVDGRLHPPPRRQAA